MFEEVLSILFCIFVGNTGEEKASHWSSLGKVAMLFLLYKFILFIQRYVCMNGHILFLKRFVSLLNLAYARHTYFWNFIQNSSVYLIQPSESFVLCWSACWTRYLFLGMKKNCGGSSNLQFNKSLGVFCFFKIFFIVNTVLWLELCVVNNLWSKRYR